MAYFADYSRVNSAVNGQAGYAGRLSGLSGTFSGKYEPVERYRIRQSRKVRHRQ